jgi:hypothetical protein
MLVVLLITSRGRGSSNEVSEKELPQISHGSEEIQEISPVQQPQYQVEQVDNTQVSDYNMGGYEGEGASYQSNEVQTEYEWQEHPVGSGHWYYRIQGTEEWIYHQQ